MHFLAPAVGDLNIDFGLLLLLVQRAHSEHGLVQVQLGLPEPLGQLRVFAFELGNPRAHFGLVFEEVEVVVHLSVDLGEQLFGLLELGYHTPHFEVEPALE